MIKNLTFEEIEEKYRKLVMKIALKINKSKRNNLEFEEIYQLGLIGLWKATEKFDEDKNIKFSTFAYSNIQGYILNGINKEKEENLSRSQVKLKEKISNLLFEKEVNSWTWEETKIKSGLTDEELREGVAWNKDKIDLYEKYDKNNVDGRGLIEIIPGELGIEEKIVSKHFINDLFSDLEETEKEIVKFRFIDGYTQLETSKILNIPKTTLRRKEKNIISNFKTKRELV